MNAPFQRGAVVRQADLAQPDEARRIEAFVARHRQGTPFHRPAWLGAVARGTGNGALALVVERDDQIAALLPLSLVHSPIFGRMLASSGFGVGGGALADRAGDADALFAAAEELALRRSCPTIELRGGPLPQDRPGWTIRHDSHCGFVAGLATNDEAQLAWVPRKPRAEVRKGLAADLTVDVGP